MVIFHCYVSSPEGIYIHTSHINTNIIVQTSLNIPIASIYAKVLAYGAFGDDFSPSMDWIRGKFTGKAPYLLGKSMVSGQDFPLNESIDSSNQTWITWQRTSHCLISFSSMVFPDPKVSVRLPSHV